MERGVEMVENIGRAILYITLERHLLFVSDFEAFNRTRYGQISPRALLPLPGTERGVDIVENIRRAKTRKKLRISKLSRIRNSIIRTRDKNVRDY
jgi:hypothetical protein